MHEEVIQMILDYPEEREDIVRDYVEDYIRKYIDRKDLSYLDYKVKIEDGKIKFTLRERDRIITEDEKYSLHDINFKINSVKYLLTDSLERLRERITLYTAEEVKKKFAGKSLDEREDILREQISKHLKEVGIDSWGIRPIAPREVTAGDMRFHFTIGGPRDQSALIRKKYPQLNELVNLMELYNSLPEDYAREQEEIEELTSRILYRLPKVLEDKIRGYRN